MSANPQRITPEEAAALEAARKAKRATRKEFNRRRYERQYARRAKA